VANRAKRGVFSRQCSVSTLPSATPHAVYVRRGGLRLPLFTSYLLPPAAAGSSVANSLKFVFISLTLALLAAIVYCVLGPYSHMSRIWWIPDWVGNWADRHPYFRNFPPFAAFSALLFFVWQFLSPVSDLQSPASGLRSLGSASCLLPTSKQSFSLFVPSPLILRRATLCFGAVALIGTSLEFLQQMIPERAAYAHPWQIMWSVAGAFVGAFGAASLMHLFYTSNGAGLPTDARKADGLAQP